ncbi:MAG TPA: flagellar biosynthetic protein FliO [Acidimicrobiales bacterium]|jgi:flagellar biogenesis protein FliO|nr:flagellar biosynthetic protein FliO [Acidimicrobiales bacterium]
MAVSFFAVLRMLFVLGSIVGVLLVLGRIAKKRQLNAGRGAFAKKSVGGIEVLSRKSLGQHVSLSVVRVGNRSFLVGQSSQQMTLLAELNGDESMDTVAPLASSHFGSDQLLTPGKAWGTEGNPLKAWDAFVDRLREMTVRR